MSLPSAPNVATEENVSAGYDGEMTANRVQFNGQTFHHA